jgi:hypothetical protein
MPQAVGMHARLPCESRVEAFGPLAES